MGCVGYHDSMSEPTPMSPAVAAVAAHVCRLCGGHEYVHIPEMFVSKGSGDYTFEALVCTACRHTDLFADDVVRLTRRVSAHRVVRVPA